MYIIKKELLKFTKEQSVLVIDDEPLIIEQLSRKLKELFRRVEFAKNGDEAFKKYLNENFDIIIADISMPVMNGIDFLKEIREIDYGQRVIFISAHNDTDYFRELINLNANGFLLKPIRYNELMNLLYINSEAVFQRREHQKNIQKIKELSKDLDRKNLELKEVNKKFRTLYKRLILNIERDIKQALEDEKLDENFST